jgi:hypothetical protein
MSIHPAGGWWTRDPQWEIRNAFVATTRDRNVAGGAVMGEWDVPE